MVIRKPYKFLIKNFKKIHLFLSFILIYVCYKSSVLLNYFNKLIEGTASRNLSLNYVNNFISKSDQLVFHQKVTFPKQPFRSYSYCMYNILGMGSHP